MLDKSSIDPDHGRLLFRFGRLPDIPHDDGHPSPAARKRAPTTPFW